LPTCKEYNFLVHYFQAWRLVTLVMRGNAHPPFD
jgi:hypothetical protein